MPALFSHLVNSTVQLASPNLCTLFTPASPFPCFIFFLLIPCPGGTMPVASSLQKMLEAPALLLPMGQVLGWAALGWAICLIPCVVVARCAALRHASMCGGPWWTCDDCSPGPLASHYFPAWLWP